MNDTPALRPAARADLSDIWEYTVTAWSVSQAQTYLADLGRTFERICAFPEGARLRTEFTPPVRLWPHGQHVIVYTVTEETIDILRILHRRANWATLLSD